jgi:hypothetical protein
VSEKYESVEGNLQPIQKSKYKFANDRIRLHSLVSNNEDAKLSHLTFPHKQKCEEPPSLIGNDRRKDPEKNEECTVGLLLRNSSLAEEKLWSLDIYKQAKFQYLEAYYNQRLPNEELRNFLHKYEMFSENLMNSKIGKAFLFERSVRQENLFARVEELTLLGKQFFILWKMFHTGEILTYLDDYLYECNALVNTFKIFNLNIDMSYMLGTQYFFHSDALQLNNNLLALQKELLAYKRKYKKNLDYLRYLEPNAIKNCYLVGEHPYLDVLVFLEPNDKFNGIDHLLQIIEEHWAKAKACYFKNNFPVVRKIKEVVLLPLMSRVPECNREFLFIEETDGTKKKMVLNQILPAFIGQAVFLQTDQVFTKTRQLVAVGFSNNSIPKLAKSSR